MSRPVIVGGSISGLAMALFLARRAIPSIVIEQDASAPGEPEWATRVPTPQAAHSHAFLSAGRRLLEAEAPDVMAGLRNAGALEIPLAAGEVSIACRRATFERSLRQVALASPLIDLRLGATAAGLEITAESPPTVSGVRLGDDSIIDASVVVDAAGRRTPVDRWLAEAGVHVEDLQVDCGIAYYSRFYRLLPDARPGPLNRGFTGGGSFDRYSCLIFPADAGAFSITFGVLPDDRALRGLRHAERFDAAARTIPFVAPWLAPGRSAPASNVALMAGLRNQLRRLVKGRTPTVLGLVKVGDAAATTNPAHTRGCTLALMHARALADVLATRPDPLRLALDANDLVGGLLEPWVEDSIAQDEARLAGWRRLGAPPALPLDRVTNGQMFTAAHADATLRDAFTNLQQLARWPNEVLADPSIVARVRTVLDSGFRLARYPAPSHEQLEAILTGEVQAESSGVVAALVG